jgi:hypothetical protein
MDFDDIAVSHVSLVLGSLARKALTWPGWSVGSTTVVVVTR